MNNRGFILYESILMLVVISFILSSGLSLIIKINKVNASFEKDIDVRINFRNNYELNPITNKDNEWLIKRALLH